MGLYFNKLDLKAYLSCIIKYEPIIKSSSVVGKVFQFINTFDGGLLGLMFALNV